MQAICPRCNENGVPAPWMHCLPCCDALIAEWKERRYGQTGPKAITVVKCSEGRCVRRANKTGFCKVHRTG